MIKFSNNRISVFSPSIIDFRFSIVISIFLVLSLTANAQTPLAGSPGSYSRIGTDAYSISVGNATVASPDNFAVGFESPALTGLVRKNYYQATTFSRGLDRNLYSIYGQNLLGAAASVSYGILYSKTGNIDGRDSDGKHTKNYETSEATGLFNFSLKPRNMNFTVGLNLKWRYADFFEDVPSTSVWAVDFGIAYPLLDEKLILALSVQDINSNYRWDTKEIYSENGNQKIDKFPVRIRFGASYQLPEYQLTILSEFENWSYEAEQREFKIAEGNFPVTELTTTGTKKYSGQFLKAGFVWKPMEETEFRAGMDRFDLTYNDVDPKFGFGFRYNHLTGKFKPSIDFAYVIEPIGPQNTFVLSLGFQVL